MLRSVGYTNYHYGNCLLETNLCLPTGQGWDYWYTALVHSGRKNSGGNCFWRRTRGKCSAHPKKTFQSKTYAQCLSSCHEFEAVFFDDIYLSCECFEDASKCSTLAEGGGISDNDVLSNRVAHFWWQNEDISGINNGSLTALIGETVLSD